MPAPGRAAPPKTDLKREVLTYAARKGRFDLVTVEPARFLMIDGHGDPNSSTAYADALGTLYPVAYTLKLLSKGDLQRDYVVPPLEALWWAEDMAAFTAARDKSAWDWTVMLAVPRWLGPEQVAAARESVQGRGTAPVLDLLRDEVLDEGLCVQTLHVGSYDDEGPVLRTMHDDVIPERGLQMSGRHHEVYLGDPRRTAPERLRTILRQPVEPV